MAGIKSKCLFLSPFFNRRKVFTVRYVCFFISFVLINKKKKYVFWREAFAESGRVREKNKPQEPINNCRKIGYKKVSTYSKKNISIPLRKATAIKLVSLGQFSFEAIYL